MLEKKWWQTRNPAVKTMRAYTPLRINEFLQYTEARLTLKIYLSLPGNNVTVAMSRRDALSSSTAGHVLSTSTTAGLGLAVSGARTLSTSGGRCTPSSQAGYEAVFDSATEGVNSRFICPVCLTVLRQPVQTKCGHRFCKSCFIGSNL